MRFTDISLRLWGLLRGSMKWRLLWLLHAKFSVGVTGVLRNDAGEVLLLNHRFWSPTKSWGLPTGYAEKQETLEQTVIREVKEETGLAVTVGKLVRLKSGFRHRLEVAYLASLVGGTLQVDGKEISEAKWFSIDDLASGLHPAHRSLIELSQSADIG